MTDSDIATYAVAIMNVSMKVMLFDLNLNESWIRVLDAAIVLEIVESIGCHQPTPGARVLVWEDNGMHTLYRILFGRREFGGAAPGGAVDRHGNQLVFLRHRPLPTEGPRKG